MGKNVKVNVSGVSMSVETGEIKIIIDQLLESLKKEILRLSGGDDPAKLKLSINILKKNGMILGNRTPEQLDEKNLNMWLELSEEYPDMPGYKLCEKLVETGNWKIFFNVEVKKPQSDPLYWCINSIRRYRKSLKI